MTLPQSKPRILGTAVDYDGMIDLLAARKAALGLSNRQVDLHGFADGFCDKALGPAREKSLGAKTMTAMMEVLAIDWVAVESLEKAVRMAAIWEVRNGSQVRDNPNRVSRRQLVRVMTAIGAAGNRAGAASKGGLARAAKLSKRRRREIARRAAQARWAT